MKLKVLLLSALLSTIVFAGDSAHVYARVQIGPNGGKVNRVIDYQAHHEMFISNPSADHVMTYTWIYKLCAEKKGCGEERFTKTLNPGEIYTEHHISQSKVLYDRVGTYSIWATTQVIGEYSEFESRSNAVDVFY